MARRPETLIEKRLRTLETHLKRENEVLLNVVRSFRKLDTAGRRMGLLGPEDSYATRVPWWPVIAVLGTFSAGKSSFINGYVGTRLQLTGNQAVDDRFTVMCFSGEEQARVLPGVALDADPRFPFYRISREIEAVSAGEGHRIDTYLQLKTCPAENLRGKILIDSPGFDADAQRDATLRITDHIIDLSDLVLVFFDARHPEPGAMRDTLEHLVAETIRRNDAGKFLYILNQIDATAKEDNPEEVVAAWQRALASCGLTAGRFYRIYNEEAATPIEDPNLRARFQTKRDEDLAEIHGRMHQVEIERAYRIIGALEETARNLEEHAVPSVRGVTDEWRKRVWTYDAIVAGIIAAGIGGAAIANPTLATGLLGSLFESGPLIQTGLLVVLGGLALLLHFNFRKLAAARVINSLRKEMGSDLPQDLENAFHRNTRWSRSIFRKQPVGWGRGTAKLVRGVISDCDDYIQQLNNRFTNPSGRTSSEKA
jgi:hypothetical protein